VTQEKIVNFVSVASQLEHVLALPTGLVIAGPSIASHGPFFERLGRRIKDGTNSAYFVLTSGESPNLKTLLKNLIKKATSRVEDDDEDDLGRSSISSKNGPKLLDFDLGHLQEWQSRNKVDSIVVTIQDSEAIDSTILIEMVDLF
jgi:origin recognition complex subunit 3